MTIQTMRVTEFFMIDKADTRRTKDGYLVASPRVGRSGIQIYKGHELGKPHLDQIRVWRPEAEVFDKEALASVAHRPITNDHPAEPVTADNWKKYAVGQTAGDVARDGDFIRVPLVLMDSAAIADVEAGKKELSLGYTSKLEWRSGTTPEGETYDAVQTQIRINHLAIVDVARGGSKLAIGDKSAPAPSSVPELAYTMDRGAYRAQLDRQLAASRGFALEPAQSGQPTVKYLDNRPRALQVPDAARDTRDELYERRKQQLSDAWRDPAKQHTQVADETPVSDADLDPYERYSRRLTDAWRNPQPVQWWGGATK